MIQKPPTYLGRFATSIDHCLEVSVKMRPAELASLDPQVAFEAITDDHFAGRRSQHGFGDLSRTGWGDGEDRHQVGLPRRQPPTRTLRTARKRGPNAPVGTPGGKVPQVPMRQRGRAKR
jgi:hypothetical protein